LKGTQIFYIVNDDLFGNLFIIEKQEYSPMAESQLNEITKEMNKINERLSDQSVKGILGTKNAEQEQTFEQAVDFEKQEGLIGDEVYQDITVASMRSSSIVKRVFGCTE
jgi:hypothetical protein